MRGTHAVRTGRPMFREDYVIRMIKQFAHALARMLGHRKAGEYEQALRVAGELFDELGISRELVDVVDTPTLASMLRYPDNIRACAQLFWQEGDIYKAKGDPLTAFARWRRAHELYLEARAADPKPEDDTALFELSRLAPAQFLDERYQQAGEGLTPPREPTHE